MIEFLLSFEAMAEQTGMILLGTFVGAAAAFQLQRRADARQRLGEEAAAGRWAQFVLCAQANTLIGVDTQHLKPLQAKPERALLLQPIDVAHGVPLLDIERISFLFEKTDPDTLNELPIGQQSYESVIGILELRKPIHLEFQDRYRVAEQAGRLVEPASLPMIEAAVGANIVRQLMSLTDQLYERIVEATDWNTKNNKALRAALMGAFPKQQFLNVIPAPGKIATGDAA